VSAPGGEVQARPGTVASDVAAEFPDLRLLTVTASAAPGRSPPELRQQMKDLSDRFRGSHAVVMRQAPIPHAYRVFYRQVGLDPDADRTPVEGAAVERLLRGAYKSCNLLDDALTISLVETGVPVWALDATRVEGELGIRLAGGGEHLGRGEHAPPVPPGRIVVSDDRTPLAVLFGELAPGHGVAPETRRIMLFSVGVPGVPSIHVEEALWLSMSILGAA